MKAKSEKNAGDWRQMIPSIVTRIEDSQRATWQRLAGGTDVHGEEKKRDEEF